MTFVHLHTHSEFSALDGASRIPDLVARAVELGQPAVAVTDHGSLAGAYRLYKEATSAGIKPLIGCELYVAPDSRLTKTRTQWGTPEQKSSDLSKGAYTHLTVIATNAKGLENLFRLQHDAHDQGFYHKPRTDFSKLAELNQGLVVLSGCASGALATRLRLDQQDEALKLASDYKDVFGDRYFIEVMEHGIDWEESLNAQLLHASKYLGVPLVATNDSHYTCEEDLPVQKALLHLQTWGKFSGFDGSGYHLRSRTEMEQLGLPREALDISLSIADSCESDYGLVFDSSLKMPVPVDNADFRELLRQKAYEGIKCADDTHVNRLEYELEVICELGYAGYFLVLADIVERCNARGIFTGPGRGSGAGSLVAYSLGITGVDPIRHGLVFERFLNPERQSLPDIDVDFPDDRRGEVLAIVREAYGNDNVAQIGTFSTIGAKAAIQDSARVLGYDRKTSDDLKAKLPPAIFGRQPDLASTFSPDDSDIMTLAFGLEGLTRQMSQHAGGVVISPKPLVGKVPLWQPTGTNDNVTELNMHEVEALGYVKFDLLGLTQLGVINACTAMLVSQESTSTRGCAPESLSLEQFDDQATFRLLQAGNTLGVFQLDGSGMRGLLRKLRPTTINDISACIALYRPGPMGVNAHYDYADRKNGRQGITPIHSELAGVLAPILEETYGLIVYQEQVMAALSAVAGWNYGEAGLLFDAMRKKNTEKMLSTKPAFFSAAQARGFSAQSLEALWDVLVPFADYSFNKAHAMGYAYLSYQTAYLKANHPREYISALLTKEKDSDKVKQYIRDAAKNGVRILPPDINKAEAAWSPAEGGIRFGLEAIRHVGGIATKEILAGRPYRSLHDFFARAHPKVLNARVLGALVKSGALDSLWSDREGLAETAVELAELALVNRQHASKGQKGIVKSRYRPKLQHETNYVTRTTWEKEFLGVKLSAPKVTVTTPKHADESFFHWLVMTLPRGNQEIFIKVPNTSLAIRRYSAMTTELKEALEGAGAEVVIE